MNDTLRLPVIDTRNLIAKLMSARRLLDRAASARYL